MAAKDQEEINTDLHVSQDSADLETADDSKVEDLDNQESAIGSDIETADDSKIENPGADYAIDEILNFNEEATESFLDTDTFAELEDVNTEGEKCDNELGKENSSESMDIVNEKCQQLEGSKEVSAPEESTDIEASGNVTNISQQPGETNYIDLTEDKVETKTKSLQDDAEFAVTEIRDSVEEKWLGTEQLEEELCAGGDNNEEMSTGVCFVDKEVDGDHNEMEEIQYIDEEACEDQQLSDIMENIENQKTNENSELQKEKYGEKQSEIVDLSEDCEVTIDLTNLSTVESHKIEKNDDSKFEEISEGSIDQDQEELAVEAISDVEIIGESFTPKKNQNDKNAVAKEGKTNVRYKEAESLEEVFFATENDDVKITAEDKDNDDISDASLSDHAEANLSLEEISDDDLEPSKKRKKPSGMTPIKTEKNDENTRTDIDNANNLAVKCESAKTNQTNVTLPKRAASTEIGGVEGNSSKRFKMSGDAKGNEETPRGETDQGLFTIMSGDLKKEGKKLQTKDSEVSHGRGVLNKRNMSQSFKVEQQDSREKSFSSRDLVDQRRRFELVSTGCQTEPRQLKGKIVQCNINPIQTAKGLGQLEGNSETYLTESKLTAKFKNQLPSSIPEKIFTQVTSLQPPNKENTFSFSMGPVTLSDMDCPKFRDVLRGAEEFSLAFDRQCHGILKATHAKHDSLASMISQLKRLELGNRYMIMSVVYKCGSEKSVDVWKATLMFMYEQDIQIESQNLVSDGKIRAKLCLKGVPKGISKDFIHLLFPGAINVSTGPGTLEERSVVLGVSSSKIVEEILSCYDLLIICGSQINISNFESAEVKQNLPTDVIEESATQIIEGTKSHEESTKTQDISVNLESETDNCETQKELEPEADRTNKNEIEGSKSSDDSKQPDQIKEVDFNETDGLSTDFLDLQKEAKKDSVIEEEEESMLHNPDTCEQTSQMTTEANSTTIADAPDISTEDTEIHEKNIQESRTEKLNEVVTSPMQNGEKKLEETVIIISEDEHSVNSEKLDVNRASCIILDEADNTISTTTGSQVNKPEDSIQDNKTSEMELPTSTKTPSACSDNVHLEESMEDTQEGKLSEVKEDAVTLDSKSPMIAEEDSKNPEKEVNKINKEANKETSDENLEDVSDEEMINQNKHDLEDVVILREDSSQWVAAHIDLTNEESNTSGKVVNENTKSATQEKNKHIIAHMKQLHDCVTSSGDTGGQNLNPKLVMMDEGLEISMEVIDVIEGDQAPEKVIYARTWRKSVDRFRERNIDSGNYKDNPYAHMSWRENQWSHAGKSDTYNRSYDKHYPIKEDVSRIPRHYYSGKPHEPAYVVPARESTSLRRDSGYSKYRSYRNRSQSPKRDLEGHGHSGFHAVEHQTGVTDRRYQKWQVSTYGDSRRSESYSRPTAESSSRSAHWQTHRTAYHSPHTRHEDQHSSIKPGDRHSHSDSRGPHYNDRIRDYRKSRSQSLSDMSISSEELPPKRKSSYRRESPKRSGKHVSHSPISVSSRSRSLSPVSKSPSVEYTQAEAGKEELVKTVKHFLELAKGIQQAQKRRPNRSRSPKSPSSRHSKSPLLVRLSSPTSGIHGRKVVRSSRHVEPHSPHRMRSRSPKRSSSRHSRSSSYSRRQRYKHERSASRSPHGDNYKKHKRDRSHSRRRGSAYRRESESPDHHYESKRSQRQGDNSKPYEDQGSRSKSGQYSDSKYKSSSDQSWQQSFGGYQPPQSSGPVPSSGIYNPPYPPPGLSPQQPTGMYSSSSVPVYPYSNPTQYNYTSIPPPYVHNVAQPPVGQSYQSSYAVYQPQPYSSTGHHNAPLQSTTTGDSGSNNSSSKNKKSWSMGSKAMVFQRVLGSDHKGKSVKK